MIRSRGLQILEIALDILFFALCCALPLISVAVPLISRLIGSFVDLNKCSRGIEKIMCRKQHKMDSNTVQSEIWDGITIITGSTPSRKTMYTLVHLHICMYICFQFFFKAKAECFCSAFFFCYDLSVASVICVSFFYKRKKKTQQQSTAIVR